MAPFDVSANRWVGQDWTTESRLQRLRVQLMEGRKNLKTREMSKSQPGAEHIL